MPEDYLTRKLLTLLGDADQVDEVLKERAAEELDRFDGGDEPPEDGNEEETGVEL